MNWWRAHHGISNDSKLAVVALQSMSKRCEVGWIWIILLDFASQNHLNRGSIDGLDYEQIALMSDLRVEQVSEIIGQLRQRGLIHQDGTLSAWCKRQPKRERDDDDSAERKRKQRSRPENVTPENATVPPEILLVPPETINVTPCPAQTRTEESRTEESREELKPFSLAPHSEANGNGKRPQKVWFDQQHEHWYKAYWCHKGKIASRRAFEKAINRVHDREHVGYNQALAFLTEKSSRDKRRFEYTKEWESRVRLHPATWLNGERWTDGDEPQLTSTGKSVVGTDPSSLDGYQELK